MKRPTAKSNDSGPESALKALRRAAKRARELGVRTGTPVYVIRDHQIVDLTEKEPTNGGKTLRHRVSR